MRYLKSIFVILVLLSFLGDFQCPFALAPTNQIPSIVKTNFVTRIKSKSKAFFRFMEKLELFSNKANKRNQTHNKRNTDSIQEKDSF